MTNDVEYFEICWKQCCFDGIIKCSRDVPNLKGVFKFEHKTDKARNDWVGGTIALSSQFKNVKQFKMEFTIHSF